MKLWALGVNHHSAPLQVRERFAVDSVHMQTFLQGLQCAPTAGGDSLAAQAPADQVQEALVLSTCNRTELFLVGSSQAQHHAWRALAQHAGLSWESVEPYSRTRSDRAAMEHVLRVAAGLDSMVLGETQISGQLKQAAKLAEEASTLGPVLKRLLQQAYSSAKAIRSHTAIGRHSISMAAAVVRLAAQVFEDVADARVLLVGAGEMIALVASHFAPRVKQPLTIANRGRARAEALAAQFQAHTLTLPEVADQLAHFDVVVSCTASLEPILFTQQFVQALKQRRHKPMVVVDLAVPRDIEASVAQLEDVYAYTVDDLAQIVQEGMAQRSAALAQADAYVQSGVTRFADWLELRGQPPLMQALQQQVQTWRDDAVQRAQRQLAQGMESEQVLQQLAQAMLQKALHGARKEWARVQTSTLGESAGLSSAPVLPLTRAAVQSAIQQFFLYEQEEDLS